MTDSIDRDHTLGSSIDALPVPGHRDRFWDDLRAELRAGVDSAERRDEPTDDAPGAPGPGSEGIVIDLQGRWRHPRWHRFGRVRPLLAAAAVAVVAAASLAAVRNSRHDDTRVDAVDVGPTSTPAGTTQSTAATRVTGPAAAGDGSLTLVPGSEVAGFSGLIAALLPSGTTVLVIEDDTDTAWGECGSAALYAVDVASGERTRVESPAGRLSVTDVNGAGETVGAIACEAVVSGVTVARWADDGSLLSAREITGDLFPGTSGSTDLDFLRTLHWGGDGSLLAATGTGAYELPSADGSASADLGVGPALWADRDATGRTAAVLTSGEVVLEGEVVATVAVRDDSAAQFGDGTMMGITGVRIDAEGAVWVASVTDGVVRVGPGEEPRQIDPDPAAALVPTGGGMLWITGDPASDGPFITRGLVKGVVTDLVSNAVMTGDPAGTLLARSDSTTGSDGTVSFKTTVMDMRPVP